MSKGSIVNYRMRIPINYTHFFILDKQLCKNISPAAANVSHFRLKIIVHSQSLSHEIHFCRSLIVGRCKEGIQPLWGTFFLSIIQKKSVTGLKPPDKSPPVKS